MFGLTVVPLLLIELSGLGAVVQEPAAQMASEETTVRTAYAKLAMAARIHSMRSVLSGPGDVSASPGDELSFAISNVKTGFLSALTDFRISDLLTKPSGYTIQAAPGDWTVAGPESKVSSTVASVQWQKDERVLNEDWDAPIARLIEALEPGYTRYTSFNVRVSFEGRQRSYLAMFMFGRSEGGASKVLPLDHVTGGSALGAVLGMSIVPGTLLVPENLSRPEVRAFVDSLRADPGCVSGSDLEVCCHPATGRCGISSNRLR